MNNPCPQEAPSTATSVSSEIMKSVNEIALILVAVSGFIALGTAVFRLDFIFAVLLGLSVICLNFFLTRQILIKVLLRKDLKRRMLILYTIKLGISAVALYVAIVHFQFPGLGVLIGLSNIAITIFLYSIKQILLRS